MKTRLTAVGPDVQVYTRTIPALTDLDRKRRLRRMRTTLKRPGVWVTGPLTRRKLYPPTRRTH
jgi:hypothetical protein